jgi:hypothetical protein
MREPLRVLLVGALIGLAILGVGGRLAMSAIAISAGQRPAYSFGGTMTVVFLGAVSGLAGAAIALLCRWLAMRFAARWPWIQYAVFAAALMLVTARGLRGTPSSAQWSFYVLVALYGLALALLMSRRQRVPPSTQSQRPGRLASE